MHTSSIFASSDFQYWHLDGNGGTQVDFATFCPAYSEFDRVGVVCPHLEDGVLNTAYALLGITTSFYDIHRARGDEFFNYPQHFAFIASTADGVSTRGGPLPLERNAMGAPWSNLDVWPESQWIPASGTATGMLEKVFSFQINRLFWPEGFAPEADEIPLPTRVRRLLLARLKTVYYYNPTAPNVEIHVVQKVEDIVQGSIAQLPQTGGATLERAPSSTDEFPYVEAHRQLGVDEFLGDVASCFEP